MTRLQTPVVLVFAGTDSSGGAGLAADIETVVSLGCHPAPVVTAVTAQDTATVKQFSLVEPELVVAQARAVLEDMPVAAFKTGMLGHPDIVSAVASVVDDYPGIPLVVDPVLATSQGQALSEAPLEEVLRIMLVPRATVLTPNSLEARRLAPTADSLDACAHELMSGGSEFVLITGTHEDTPKVIHRLYGGNRRLEDRVCRRVPGEFHGSGCTLAAAIAANLAHGAPAPVAVDSALDYTLQAIEHGYRPGMGQHLPDRLYWARAGDGPRRRDRG